LSDIAAGMAKDLGSIIKDYSEIGSSGVLYYALISGRMPGKARNLYHSIVNCIERRARKIVLAVENVVQRVVGRSDLIGWSGGFSALKGLLRRGQPYFAESTRRGVHRLNQKVFQAPQKDMK
jgi:hypothetical protein